MRLFYWLVFSPKVRGKIFCRASEGNHHEEKYKLDIWLFGKRQVQETFHESVIWE